MLVQSLKTRVVYYDRQTLYCLMQAKTFFVKPGSYGRPPTQSALGLANLGRQSQPDNLSVALEVKSISATFYDDFGGFVSTNFSILWGCCIDMIVSRTFLN